MRKMHANKIAGGMTGILTAVLLASPALADHLLPSGASYDPSKVSVHMDTTTGVGKVDQTAKNVVINWNDFSIGALSSVTFAQPTGGIALNRVTGNNRSLILGTLNANGTIVIANGSGIYFGPTSHVNVGRLVATTSEVTMNSDGKLNFSPRDKNVHHGAFADTIINDGQISTVAEKGLVAFVAPYILNDGTVTANVGTVVMTTADTATAVDLYGDGLLKMEATGDVKNRLISNMGTIKANGGTVVLTAAVAGTVVDSLINMDGLIQADSVKDKDGKIQYGSVTLEAGAVQMARAGDILPATISANDGTISISGTKGNALQPTGVAMSGARVNAGNGSITISGTGRKDSANGNNHGVALMDGTQLSVKDGVITITGNGGSDQFFGNSCCCSGAGSNYGIYIAGGSTVKATGTGSITMTGTGGESLYRGDNNYGVFIEGKKSLVSSESGAISVTGNGGGKLAYSSSAYNYGVLMANGAVISSNTGRIAVKGTGGGSTVPGNENYGVYMADRQTAIKTVNGAISISGFGGGTKASFGGSKDDFGVFITSASTVQATGEKGSISIFGKGGGAGTNAYSTTGNYGVYLSNYAALIAKSGSIEITGIGGGDNTAAHQNYGIVLTDGASVGGLEKSDMNKHLKRQAVSDSGQITFITDTIMMDDSAYVQTTGNVHFKPYTKGTSVGIAGAGGTLQLTKTVLDDVHAGSITIGTTENTGDITANGYSWSAPVSLFSYMNIAFNGVQKMNGNALLAHTVGGKGYTITIGEKGGIVDAGANGGVFSGEGEGSQITAITLAVSDGDFVNKAGPGALKVREGSRWLVYTSSPLTVVQGGLAYSFEQYNAPYATPAAQSWGNGFLYKTPLEILTGLTGATKQYDATMDVPASFGTSNFIFANGYTGSVSYGYALYDSPNAGDRTITAYGVNVSDVKNSLTGVTVYGYSLGSTLSAAGKITQAPLTLTANSFTKPYGKTYSFNGHEYSLSGTFYGSDSISGVTLDSLGADGAAKSGSYAINIGNAQGVGLSNYDIKYVGGVMTVAPMRSDAATHRDARAPGRRGPTGTLLAIANMGAPVGGLADLAPKAGGDNPGGLADLSPQAGGNVGVTPLIQCTEATPCDINQ